MSGALDGQIPGTNCPLFVSDDVICLQWFHLSAMVSFVSNGVICQQQRRVSSQRVEQWWFATNRYGG
jgi:hypothetical protein